MVVDRVLQTLHAYRKWGKWYAPYWVVLDHLMNFLNRFWQNNYWEKCYGLKSDFQIKFWYLLTKRILDKSVSKRPKTPQTK